jgi:hypothetical protein
MLKTVGELVDAISQLINSAETSVVFVAHPQFNLITMGGFRIILNVQRAAACMFAACSISHSSPFCGT